MPDLLTYALALIPLAIAGVLIWLYLTYWGGAAEEKKDNKAAYQGVVKKDWVATGRIDFATQEDSGTDDPGRPAEFRLLVEERRIVQSLAGNENLEIQWRLATLKEAKVVIASYHKHLADNSMIKTVVAEETPAPAAPPATEPPPAQAVAAEATGKPPGETHMRVVGGNS